MLQYMQPGARLSLFLQEIYGNQPAMTRVEVDVEGLSGGVQGTPHLEATQVRIYDAGGMQLLPDFEAVSYWKEMLATYPKLFQACTTHQDRLQTMHDLLEEERIYLDYGLDWPDLNEKVVSPLHFAREELRQMASKETSNAEALDQQALDGNTDEKRDRSPEHALAGAESALATLQKAWVQNVFGDEVTDVLFDVLKEFIARRRFLLGLQDQHLSPVARVFHTIWDNSSLREMILKSDRHERLGEGPVNEVYEALLQFLEDKNLQEFSERDFHKIDLDPFVDFLIAYVGKGPLDPVYLAQHGFDPQLLRPRVMASCHSDDFVVEVKNFDATLWLAQASDEELRALRNEGYGGNDTADKIAEFMAAYDPYVRAIFHYNDTLPKSVELRGFECHVNEEEAEVWIAWHRPHLFTDKEKNGK